MSNIAILYGSILATAIPTYSETGEYPTLSHNLQVLAGLPGPEGNPPPRFTHTLFTLTGGEPFAPGFFKIPVIHFGGSFKNLDGDWDRWLLEFESLLRRLYWDKAALHLALEWAPEGFTEREYHYHWKAQLRRDIEDENWVFSGGPRTFQRLH